MSGGDDRGAGSVVTLAAVLVVTLSCIAATGFGGALVVRARAAAAADSAALAAALSADVAPAAACDRARMIAQRNSARLAACTLDGAVATVQVVLAPPQWLSWAGSARLNARAGPAETNQEQPGRVGLAS